MPYVKLQNTLTDIDPLFTGNPPADYRLTSGSPALKLGFRPIPFEKIGIYKSSDRASWPVDRR
jgi:hypothetical protein